MRRAISLVAAAVILTAVEVWPMSAATEPVPPLPRLSPRAAKAARAYRAGEAVVLENDKWRGVFLRGKEGYQRAVWFIHDGDTYLPVGTSRPLGDVVYVANDGTDQRVEIAPAAAETAQLADGAAVTLTWDHTDADHVPWKANLRFEALPQAGRVAVTYTLRAEATRQVRRFGGPIVRAGDGAFGAEKSFALFPGLEYLEGNEASSSPRDAEAPISERYVPHPYRVTVPVMAVSKGPFLVGLAWNQSQSWDGEHDTVAAQFASPNSIERLDEHLMRLFLPAVPKWVPENKDLAATPYDLAAQKPISIQAQILLDYAPGLPGETILRAMDHYYAAYGVPEPPPRPRDTEAEFALSRYALLHTVWDEQTQKSRHCVDWAPANAPGFGTLLWLDAQLTQDAAVRETLLDRVALIAHNTIRDDGEQGLASGADCHILRWEFPFYYGHLRKGLLGAEAGVRGGMASQKRDGSWRFEPDNKRRSLGKFGDSVVGLCAAPARDLLRYARITGDRAALDAGLKGLKFMERFAVPQGAQSWECPLYEPDILASGMAVPAYLEGYRCTGERAWLDRAIYWARTGLPFLFAHNRADTPGMRYASIPVFGTTFYTHSWLGVPVQWNGMVYAYNLQHLAPYDRSFPWSTVAEGITVSGMWQQIEEEGKLKGTYCDGWYEFCTDKRGAWINPEDILVNLLTLMGHDPDISTAILPDPIASPGAGQARVHISSGARVSKAKMSRGVIAADLTYFAGQPSYTLVAGVGEPTWVKADDRELPRVADTDAAAEGWDYDAARGWLVVKAPHTQKPLHLAVAAAPR